MHSWASYLEKNTFIDARISDDDVKRAKAAVDRHRANIESDAENLPPKRHRWADIPSKSDRGKHRPAS